MYKRHEVGLPTIPIISIPHIPVEQVTPLGRLEGGAAEVVQFRRELAELIEQALKRKRRFTH